MDKQKGNINNLKPFKKGQSGNPGGRPKMPDDVRSAKIETKITIARLLNEYLAITLDELQARLRDPKTPNLELMVGKIVAETIKTGDNTRLNFILDRMIGKVTDKVEHAFPKPTVIKLLGDEGSLVLGSEKIDEDDI